MRTSGLVGMGEGGYFEELGTDGRPKLKTSFKETLENMGTGFIWLRTET